MAMNALQGVADCLEKGTGVVHVDPEIGRKAAGCITRMLDFVQTHPEALVVKDGGRLAGMTPGIGAA